MRNWGDLALFHPFADGLPDAPLTMTATLLRSSGPFVPYRSPRDDIANAFNIFNIQRKFHFARHDAFDCKGITRTSSKSCHFEVTNVAVTLNLA